MNVFNLFKPATSDGDNAGPGNDLSTPLNKSHVSTLTNIGCIPHLWLSRQMWSSKWYILQSYAFRYIIHDLQVIHLKYLLPYTDYITLWMLHYLIKFILIYFSWLHQMLIMPCQAMISQNSTRVMWVLWLTFVAFVIYICDSHDRCFSKWYNYILHSYTFRYMLDYTYLYMIHLKHPLLYIDYIR